MPSVDRWHGSPYALRGDPEFAPLTSSALSARSPGGRSAFGRVAAVPAQAVYERSGYHSTRVELITADPAAKVDSRDVAFGLQNCWG